MSETTKPKDISPAVRTAKALIVITAVYLVLTLVLQFFMPSAWITLLQVGPVVIPFFLMCIFSIFTFVLTAKVVVLLLKQTPSAKSSDKLICSFGIVIALFGIWSSGTNITDASNEYAKKMISDNFSTYEHAKDKIMACKISSVSAITLGHFMKNDATRDAYLSLSVSDTSSNEFSIDIPYSNIERIHSDVNAADEKCDEKIVWYADQITSRYAY